MDEVLRSVGTIKQVHKFKTTTEKRKHDTTITTNHRNCF